MTPPPCPTSHLQYLKPRYTRVIVAIVPSDGPEAMNRSGKPIYQSGIHNPVHGDSSPSRTQQSSLVVRSSSVQGLCTSNPIIGTLLRPNPPFRPVMGNSVQTISDQNQYHCTLPMRTETDHYRRPMNMPRSGRDTRMFGSDIPVTPGMTVSTAPNVPSAAPLATISRG